MKQRIESDLGVFRLRDRVEIRHGLNGIHRSVILGPSNLEKTTHTSEQCERIEEHEDQDKSVTGKHHDVHENIRVEIVSIVFDCRNQEPSESDPEDDSKENPPCTSDATHGLEAFESIVDGAFVAFKKDLIRERLSRVEGRIVALVEDEDLGFLEASRDEEKDEKESKIDAAADVEGRSERKGNGNTGNPCPHKVHVVFRQKNKKETGTNVEDKDNRQEDEVKDVKDHL